MTDKLNLKKFPLVWFSLRLILACGVLTLLFVSYGAVYVKTVLPIINYQIKWIHPEYDIHEMSYKEQGMNREISVRISIVRRFTDEFGKTGSWRDVSYSIHASTLYSHPIILFSLLLSWPGLSIKRRLISLGCGFLLLVVPLMIDHPFHLISQAEKGLIVESFFATIREFWVFMLTNGGRQMISVLLFLLAISHLYFQLPAPLQKHVHRNAPCPCGSGKKYKHCCGKII
ncbi:MAG: SEC-C domain-containing protein [Candidatus Magnetomorum sp.]|nr:SEC-C domain-containing protein [Candidatus Magnetomorum sp.]